MFQIFEDENDVIRGQISTISSGMWSEGKGNLNCVYTFDLATEETTKIGSTLVSNEIIFQNRVLSDYSEAT